MLADQPFLSIPETAKVLDVSQSSVHRWVKSGRLKAIRLPSGRRKIRRAEVDAILADDQITSVA